MSLDFQNIHSLKLLTFLYGQNQHTLIIPRHSLHHSIELTLVIRGHIYTISISFLGNKTHLGSLIDFQEAIYTCFLLLFLKKCNVDFCDSLIQKVWVRSVVGVLSSHTPAWHSQKLKTKRWAMPWGNLWIQPKIYSTCDSSCTSLPSFWCCQICQELCPKRTNKVNMRMPH